MGPVIRRRRVKRSGDRFVLNLRDHEADILRELADALDPMLDDPSSDTGMHRLFPPAHPDDVMAEAAWQIEQGAALRDSRRASLDALRTSGPLDEVGLIAWMQGVNAVRLVVGERLGTSGDPSDDERYRRALVLAQGEGPEAEAAEALLHLAAVADLLAGLVDDAVHALGDD